MMTPQPQATPQFYAVSPQPSAPPPRPFPWRVVAWVFGGVVVLSLLGVAGWNVWQARPAVIAARQATERLVQEQSACAEGDSACLTAAQRSVAQESGRVALCDGLAPSAFAVCVTRIALDSADPRRCDVLSDDARDDCRDLVAPAYAVAQRQYTGCREAVTEQGIARCEMRVREAFVGTEFCASAGVPVEACQAVEALQRAIASADPAQCAAFAEDMQDSCLDAVNDADTDGDGYTNGEEIAGGYNPLGQ